MTQLFARLVDRGLTPVATVRPRVPGRFEAATPAEEGPLAEVTTHVSAPAPSPHPVSDVARIREQDTHTPAAAAQPGTDQASQPARRAAQQERPEAAPAVAARENSPTLRRAAALRDPAEDASTVGAPLRPAPRMHEVPPAVVATAHTPSEAMLQPVLRPARAASDTAVAAQMAPPAVRPVLPPSHLAPRPTQAAAQPPARADDSTTIHISIGRIDVHTSSAPAVASRRPARQARAPLALDEYQRQRARGER